MKISSASLHYRLASVYGKLDDYETRTNLCRYTTHLFIGLFFVACAVLLGSVIVYGLLVGPAFWIRLCFEEGRFMPMLIDAACGFVVWSLAGGAFAMAWWGDRRDEQGKPFVPMPSLVREAYRGWKDRYCPTVEIETA